MTARTPLVTGSDAGDAKLERRAAQSPIKGADSHGRPFALPLVGLLLVNAAWAALMHQFESGGVYWLVGTYACLVMVAIAIYYRSALGRWFRPHRSGIALGAAFGAGMTLLTYPLYELAIAVVPALEGQVASLYTASRQEELPVALAWVVVILAAEEVLWRGAWLDLLRKRLGTWPAGIVSVLLYGLGQLGSGSFIVFALAIGCGAVWTYLRVWTRSLWAPLVAHFIWTPIVILLVPVV